MSNFAQNCFSKFIQITDLQKCRYTDRQTDMQGDADIRLLTLQIKVDTK